MGRPNATRRHCLRALGLASIGGLAGCSSDSAGDDTGGTTTDDSDGTATDNETNDSTGTDTLTPTTTLAPSTSPEVMSPTATTSGPQTEQSELGADDGGADDGFGSALAVSEDGTTAIIGASGDGDPNGRNAGSAYVFEDSDGSWSQQAKLTADDGDDGDRFGISAAVSADGTTAIIGAQNDEDPNVEELYEEASGSAYVFEASDGSWSQQAKLFADDGDYDDRFGCSVALSDDGTTAVIGAYGDEDPNGNGEYGDDGAGAAYVFEDSDGSWSQEAKLAADDGDGADDFGVSVTVSADATTAVIGAWSDEDPNGDSAGSAYVFEDSDGSWSQQAKLAADDGGQYDDFGYSVSITDDGTTVVIGPLGDNSAYIFEESDGAWSQQSKLTADDGDSSDEFGASVAISDDGTTAIIGADGDEDPNGENENGNAAGSAYVFEDSDGSWSQTAKLAADEGDPTDNFGDKVAVSETGETALIGDPNHDNNAIGAGSTYVYDV